MGLRSLISMDSLLPGDAIKTQSSFSEFYEGYGWFGGFTSLTNDEMYAVKLQSPSTLSVWGAPVILPKTISLSSGWNWIPNPYQTVNTLSEAIPIHSIGYTEGDKVKSQFQFAEYYGSYGWFGNLVSFDPGTGYRLKTTNSGTGTFL